MIVQAEQLLQRGSDVASSLLPALFNIFSQWRLTGAQQMTLLGLSNEKTLYNWKSRPEKAKLTRDLLERASYILGIYKSLTSGWPRPTTIRYLTARHRLIGCWRGRLWTWPWFGTSWMRSAVAGDCDRYATQKRNQ